MTLLEAVQMVCDESQRLRKICMECGVKSTDECWKRNCDTLPDVLAQVIIVRGLKEKGLVK